MLKKAPNKRQHGSFKALLAIPVAVFIVGCGPSAEEQRAEETRAYEAELIALLKKKVTSLLVDPSSTQFEAVKVVGNGMYLCGQINAKNRMGGYVGFKTFAVGVGMPPIILNYVPDNMVGTSRDELISIMMQRVRSSEWNDYTREINQVVEFPHWDECVENPRPRPAIADTTAATQSSAGESTDLTQASNSAKEPEKIGSNAGRSGDTVYNTACLACHMTGAGGAPVVGNAGQWADRIAKGMDVLYEHGINGIAGTAMMAKGGCVQCSDAEVRAAVDFMVQSSGG